MKKILQLNIEGDEHIELVRELIRAEDADVVCIQEVFKTGLSEVSSLPYVTFMPMLLQERASGVLDERGIAIFSKTPFMHTSTHYYFKPSEELREQDRTSEETKRTSVRHGVLTVELEGGLRIATVHHTWTQHGDKPSDYQKADTVALVEHLKTQPPCVITGDFNIPRGYNSCYEVLTSFLEDCVPKEYASSMHIPLHKIRFNPPVAAEVARYMVDYVFRTPGSPEVHDVTMRCGMSDHCALVAHVG